MRRFHISHDRPVRVLILTSWLQGASFHPHRRRLEQWLELLAGQHFEITICGLGCDKSITKQAGITRYQDIHPRLSPTSASNRILPKTEFRRVETERRLARLIGKAAIREGSFDCTIVIGTAFAGALGPNAHSWSTIVDVHDAPYAIDGNANRSLQGFLDIAYRGCSLTVLGDQEKERVLAAGVRASSVKVLYPAISGKFSPISTPEHRVSIWGRESSRLADRTLRFVHSFAGDLKSLQPPMDLEISGELARSFEDNDSVRAHPPCEKLFPTLIGTIGLILGRLNSGVSYRILDAVEAGIPVICHPSVGASHGLDPGVHYEPIFSDDDAFAAVRTLQAFPARSRGYATRMREHMRRRSSIAEATQLSDLLN